MCGGIEYPSGLIYLPNRDARLPVRLHNGNVTWVSEQTARKKQTEIFSMVAGRILNQSMPENGNSGIQGCCRLQRINSWKKIRTACQCRSKKVLNSTLMAVQHSGNFFHRFQICLQYSGDPIVDKLFGSVWH